MPDDEGGDRSAEREHEQAQVAYYGQAFQQYSSQSINAVMASDQWKTQTLPEGVLDLTVSGLGSRDLGGAEAYIQSAYCVVAGSPRHLTWFETENADGTLFLQGLGEDRAGQTAIYLRQLIARENFGVARDGAIKMADGSQIMPDNNCSSLNIPHGSAVAVIPLSLPVRMAETQDKYIMRASACPVGEEGNILQRVMASYMPDGAIMVGMDSFASESAVMADDDLPWMVLTDNCLAPTQQIARSMGEQSVDALEMAALEGLTEGDIKAALASSLTGINCKDVMDETRSEEEMTGDEKRIYDTCNDPVTIDPVEALTFTPDTEVRTEEEELTARCGGDPESETTITLDLNEDKFEGVAHSLHGDSATLNLSSFSGDVAYKRITRFYEIIADDDGMTGGRDPDGDLTRTLVTYQGLSLHCERDDRLTISCDQIIGSEG